jgi:hypothetical protein
MTQKLENFYTLLIVKLSPKPPSFFIRGVRSFRGVRHLNAFRDEGVCYDSIPNAESARGADSSCRAENGAVEIPRTREGRGREPGKMALAETLGV